MVLCSITAVSCLSIRSGAKGKTDVATSTVKHHEVEGQDRALRPGSGDRRTTNHSDEPAVSNLSDTQVVEFDAGHQSPASLLVHVTSTSVRCEHP